MTRISWTPQKIEDSVRAVIDHKGIDYFPSHSEIVEYYGDRALAVAISKHGGTRFWANKMGIDVKECESKFGNDTEIIAMDEIEANTGLVAEYTTTRYPYDLLVDKSVKVDVKASKLYCKGQHNFACTFNLEKKKQTCDVYILYCFDSNRDIYKRLIIPAVTLCGQSQISVSQQSKWNIYVDRWDIISDHAAFWAKYKSKPGRLRRVSRQLDEPRANPCP